MKKNLEGDFKKAAEEDNIFVTKNKAEQEDDLEREVPSDRKPAKKPEEDDLERDTNWKRDPVPKYAERVNRNRARF